MPSIPVRPSAALTASNRLVLLVVRAFTAGALALALALVLGTAAAGASTGRTPARPADPTAVVRTAPAPTAPDQLVVRAFVHEIAAAALPRPADVPADLPVERPAGPPPDSGAWVWPLQPEPRVVRGFEPPRTRWGRGHRGVDLAGTEGETVHAAGAGVVGYAARLAGRGVVVVIHRGGLRTTYEPVRAVVVTGTPVDPGTPIGILERPAGHCLPRVCLHWGLLRGQAYLDPLTLLTGPPRLLPLDSPAATPVVRTTARRPDAAESAPVETPTSTLAHTAAAAREPRPSGTTGPERHGPLPDLVAGTAERGEPGRREPGRGEPGRGEPGRGEPGQGGVPDTGDAEGQTRTESAGTAPERLDHDQSARALSARDRAGARPEERSRIDPSGLGIGVLAGGSTGAILLGCAWWASAVRRSRIGSTPPDPPPAEPGASVARAGFVSASLQSPLDASARPVPAEQRSEAA